MAQHRGLGQAGRDVRTISVQRPSQVYIEGRIQTRKFEDREGKERYFTDINAQQVTFLGSRDGGGTRSGQSSDDEPGGGFDDAGAGSVPPDDDVPF